MESETPILIPLKDQAKVKRVWASKAERDGQLIFIEVEVEEGVMQIWSAGKSDQGLLGHGGKTKESKAFLPVVYDHKAIQFKDISVYMDHAMAIDQNGELWTWGSNL